MSIKTSNEILNKLKSRQFRAFSLSTVEIVNFPFLDGDVPRAASYGVYISQLIRFARVSSHVTSFNTRNKLLTAKRFNQGYRYHKLRKAFLSFIDVIPI